MGSTFNMKQEMARTQAQLILIMEGQDLANAKILLHTLHRLKGKSSEEVRQVKLSFEYHKVI